ncbi:hypothetical protein C8N35_11425 [Breoghania corrubedonensis]|uniref:Uncharacterized protein n=1 Tax=Breoghania corrubedonensis TaxID=665038 RepID=A0A2T5US48_9HYPH|nr:hypothetical protein C8N35_11425 [Breoghania corrubedonensis]
MRDNALIGRILSFPFMSLCTLSDIPVRFEPKGKSPVPALDDVSLSVAHNTFSMIVGPS